MWKFLKGLFKPEPPEIGSKWIRDSRNPFDISYNLRYKYITVVAIKNGFVLYKQQLDCWGYPERTDTCSVTSFRWSFISEKEAIRRMGGLQGE